MGRIENSVFYTLSHGHYGLYSNEKQWRLSLTTPFGSISETFDEGPTFSDTVEDVLGVIEYQLENYWISSAKDEKRATIAEIKANLSTCELLYAQRRLEILRSSAEKIAKDILSEEARIEALQAAAKGAGNE